METGIMNEEGDNEAREDIQPAAILLIEGSVSRTYTMTEEETSLKRTNRGEETWKANDQAACFRSLTGGRKEAA